MRPAVAVQAVRPTAAALPWPPVLAAGTIGVAAVVIVNALSSQPTALTVVAGAALASGAVAALHDSADPMLAALPASRLARRLLRLGLVATVVGPLMVLLHRLSPASPDLGATTLALTLTGLAVATWLPPGNAVMIGAMLPVVWVATTELLAAAAGPLDVWATHPWPLTALAAAVILAGRHR